MRDGESQGCCETTYTERFALSTCTCPTYDGNLGPCKAYVAGANDRCCYCDHTQACHEALAAIHDGVPA